MLSEALQSCGVSLALTAGRICRHAGEPLAEVARCGFIVLKRVVLKATSACLLPWETVWYGDGNIFALVCVCILLIPPLCHW